MNSSSWIKFSVVFYWAFISRLLFIDIGTDFWKQKTHFFIILFDWPHMGMINLCLAHKSIFLSQFVTDSKPQRLVFVFESVINLTNQLISFRKWKQSAYDTLIQKCMLFCFTTFTTSFEIAISSSNSIVGSQVCLN